MKAIKKHFWPWYHNYFKSHVTRELFPLPSNLLERWHWTKKLNERIFRELCELAVWESRITKNFFSFSMNHAYFSQKLCSYHFHLTRESWACLSWNYYYWINHSKRERESVCSLCEYSLSVYMTLLHNQSIAGVRKHAIVCAL